MQGSLELLQASRLLQAPSIFSPFPLRRPQVGEYSYHAAFYPRPRARNACVRARAWLGASRGHLKGPPVATRGALLN